MAELPDNIKEFNTIAGLFFAQLYKAFPNLINPNPESIALAMGIDKNSWRSYMLPSGNSFNAMQAMTIGWLGHMGYTKWFGSSPSEQVLLSDKGLAAMNALPSALGGWSVGSKLIEVAEQKESKRDLSQVGSLIGGIIGGVWTTVGGI